jgi:ferredoxin
LVCAICGEDGQSVLEEHHIYGRNNSDETTLLCKNCHAKITEEQNKISPLSRSKNALPDEQRGYLLVTVGSLLELMGKYLKNLGHEVIRNE